MCAMHRLRAVDVALLRLGRGHAPGPYASALPKMTYATKVVLHCPTGCHIGLDQLVEQFIADGVKFVGVVGHDCQLVEDLIDELVVGDGSDPRRFLLTSSHPCESVEEALGFARQLAGGYAGDAQVVVLAE